jgi:hypothetical protein
MIMPQKIWDHELPTNPPAEPNWLWQGFVARGVTTLLTSPWKSGKTTLLAMLLERRVQGGSVAGLAVSAGKTVVVSEEPAALWAARAAEHRFGGHVCFYPQPFTSIPTVQQWQALIDDILALVAAEGIDLIVIDPIAPFLRGENSPRAIFEALLPLNVFTRAGLGVLLLHHPKKGEPAIGQAARGSGALLGHVDISIEMRHPGGDPVTRRRRFVSLSRFAATPRLLLMELNEEGTDYVAIPDPLVAEFQENWRLVCMVLEDAPQKLTRQDILAEWPPDFDKPAPATLRRWLDRAVEQDAVKVEGRGRKCDPLRYWLPETEAKWRERVGPELYDLLQQTQSAFPFRSLQERKRTAQHDDPLPVESDDDEPELLDDAPRLRERTVLDYTMEESERRLAEAAKAPPAPPPEPVNIRDSMVRYLTNLQKPWVPEEA